MSATEPTGERGALPLPRDTTPTWEIELLVSGATVFGLLQLPPKVEAGLVMLVNRVDQDLASLAVPLWIYLQSALLILIITFIVHLCLRAYWVALVGLHSVYPGGVNWASFKKAGPYQLETSRRNREDVPALIEAADNRASQLFGVGVGLAMTLLLPIVLVCLTIALALLFRLLPESLEVPSLAAFLVLFLGLMVPWIVALVIDQWRGRHWPAHSFGGRWLRRVLGVYAHLGMGRASNLPMALYTSNSKGHRGNLVIGLAAFVIVATVATQVISHITRWSPDDHDGLPPFTPESQDIVLPAHYASMAAREPQLRPMPYIADPVVRGPYLKLFVPYVVNRHNHALRHRCPPAANGQRSSRAALDCFARLHDVRIDGVPVADLQFDAAEDPVSGLRGMQAMIPMAGVAPGRHVLTVVPVPSSRVADTPATQPGPPESPEPYWIPFWR